MQGRQHRVVESFQPGCQTHLRGCVVLEACVATLRVRLEALSDPVAQLGCSVLGEGDCGQLGHRGKVPGGDHMDHAGDEGCGLTGSGAGLDEKGLGELGADRVARGLVDRRGHPLASDGLTSSAYGLTVLAFRSSFHCSTRVVGQTRSKGQ